MFSKFPEAIVPLEPILIWNKSAVVAVVEEPGTHSNLARLPVVNAVEVEEAFSTLPVVSAVVVSRFTRLPVVREVEEISTIPAVLIPAPSVVIVLLVTDKVLTVLLFDVSAVSPEDTVRSPSVTTKSPAVKVKAAVPSALPAIVTAPVPRKEYEGLVVALPKDIFSDELVVLMLI